MKAKIFLLLIAFICSGAAQSLRAQEQGQAQTSVQTSAAPGLVNDLGIKNYLLGPGDILDVRVFQQPDLSLQNAEVGSDGNISSLPFIQPIRAQCRTEKEVAKDIIVAYSKLLQNPQVSVRTVQRNSRPPAIVHGAVNQPQRVQMLRDVRLNELIAVSGGVTERSNGNIQVLHTEKVLCPATDAPPEPELTATTEGLKAPFKVYKFLDVVAGKEEANPVVRPGDVVTVQEAEPVYITGSVVSPQGLFLRDNLTLSRAIAMVGGVRPDGKTDEVRIYRQKPGAKQQETIKVNYAAVKKKQEADVLLEPYDIIEVPQAGPFSRQRVMQTFASSLLGIGPSIVSRLGTTLPLRVIY
jgi:polysaccharide export outer membrane protein